MAISCNIDNPSKKATKTSPNIKPKRAETREIKKPKWKK
jgi:hypothetical protein